MKKTILITGGAGFIGSQLASRLLKLNFKVVIVDNLSTGNIKNIPKSAIFYKADITNFKELKHITTVEKPDVISHHAAQSQVRFSFSHPQLDAKTNILGLLNILEVAKKFPQLHLTFASSGGAIYDSREQTLSSEKTLLNPSSPYGVSKMTSEAYLKMYKQNYPLKTTVLRYANVYGPHQSPFGEAGVISLFIHSLLSHKQPIIYGTGSHIRDYVFVDDVVNANVAVIQNTIEGTYNIGTGIQTSTLDLFNLITQKLESKIEPLFGAAQVGEQKYSCLDSSLALRTFHWKPTTPLEDGIQKTIEWQKML